MNDDTQSAIEFLRHGKKAEAGAIFARIVKANPGNEQAWLGISQCVGPEEQRRHCLQQVLRINPQNQFAKNALASLDFEPIFSNSPARPMPRSNTRQVPVMTLQRGLIWAVGIVIVVLIMVATSWAVNNVGADFFIGHVPGVSWNNLASGEQGGVKVEIARLAVYEKSSLSKNQQKAFQTQNFFGLPTLCDLYFRITNNTNQIMSVHPNQGMAMINDEQVQLQSFMFRNAGTTGGQIFPGATVTGSMTFGLKRVTPDTISSMTITFNSPYDTYFRSYGEQYIFNLDLSHHQWMNKPDELK